MEKGKLEMFLSNWNAVFPESNMTLDCLKNPHKLMRALFEVLDKLGIDRDVVVAPPPEEQRNESTPYYMDILPVINMSRVINHLVSVMPQVSTLSNISHFLQPTTTSSHSILLLLFNLMVFNDARLRDIAPYEEELFARTDQVKILDDRKNKLLVQLNEQAEEKGKRALRLEKLNQDIKQIEEELRQEKDAEDEERQELEAILKENRQTEVILEQKKTHRDTVMVEVERKRALRVYDADDIKAQAEQAAQDVQAAEEKLNSLRATLMEKENSLKNLQTIKPSLDTANNLLRDIVKMSESLKQPEEGDLDNSDSKDGELDVVNTELFELRAQLGELRTALSAAEGRRSAAQAQRQPDKSALESATLEAEEKDKKCQEQCKKVIQRTSEIKKLTFRYKEEKTAGFDVIAKMENTYWSELKTIEDALLKTVKEAEKKIEEKLENRHTIDLKKEDIS